MNTLTWFRFEATVVGMSEPMVDWYYGKTESEARAAFDEDAHRYGLPMDKTTVTVRPATEKETEICEKTH
jgi:hypothetical protein